MLNFEFQDKQERYEQKLVKQILAAHGLPQVTIGYHAAQLGDELNLRWFNESFSNCPVAVESRRIKLFDLTGVYNGKFKRSEWWKCFEEVGNNYPDRDGHALIFARHGSGYPDLVVHNRTHIQTHISDTALYQSGAVITSWAEFLTAICVNWRYSE
jgi:hypothetical protein